MQAELLQTLQYEIQKSMPKPEFKYQRSLIWNTILRNSLIKSLAYIHLYIESFEEIKNSSPEIFNSYIKRIIFKNKIKPENFKKCFKVRFMLDGFDEYLYYGRGLVRLTDENSKDLKELIKKDILSIAQKLGYKIDILDMNFISIKSSETIQKIDIFLKENYIPLKWI